MKDPAKTLLCEEITKSLEKAAYIASIFSDREIRTVYVAWAMLNEDSALSEILYTLFDMEFYFDELGEKVKSTPELFCKIFGEEMGSQIISNLKIEMPMDSMKKLISAVDEEKERILKESNIEPKPNDNNCTITFSLCDMKFNNLVDTLAYSASLQAAILDAKERCSSNNSDVVDIFNFLYSLLANPDTSARKYFELSKLDINEVLEYLESQFEIVDYNPEPNKFKLPSTISSFCSVLNHDYDSNVVCDIVGRDKEINKFWIIASRKSKKNSILIGPPGCGKTAIVEAITMSIVNKTCPKNFYGYNVISLDISSIIAGTSYRGQFEMKVKSLIDFAKNSPKIILFIDEIHHMLGAGKCEGDNMDLAGMLKPLLARDDTIVIGATTTDEYKRIFSKDGAFKRRFEIIKVEEPKIKDLKPMIAKRIDNLSKYHKVEVSDELVDYLIIQAHCFNLETANPDKTISLCDSSLAVAKMKKKRVLTKSHVDEVNSDALRKFKNLPKESKLATAYHEAGHYVASRVLKSLKYKIPIVLSIVAFDNYAGVFSYEIDDEISVKGDKTFFMESMISLMAGRASEKYFTGSINSGASNDLARISDMARNYILTLGMDDDFLNLSLMTETEDNPTFLTEKTKDIVTSKVKSLVDDVYKKTLELVEEHKAEISRIAKALAKSGMLTPTELDSLYKG